MSEQLKHKKKKTETASTLVPRTCDQMHTNTTHILNLDRGFQ